MGVPSEFLERRPDIAAAGGFESINLSKWLTWPSRFWSVGTAISEIVFEGFLRKAQTAQARAAYVAAVASYRQTVLTAFQDVEDNLAALRILEEEAAAQDEAGKSARQSEAVAVNQYKAGIVSYLNVLTAQTATLNSEILALGVLSRRMAASVLLIKALGGGWDQAQGLKLDTRE